MVVDKHCEKENIVIMNIFAIKKNQLEFYDIFLKYL